MTQLVTRISEELAKAIDDLVTEGVVASRSEAVRAALALFVDRNRRDRVGAAIIDGYRRVPQTASEVGWSDDATERMIAEEPW